MAVSNRLSYAPMTSATTYDFQPVDETQKGLNIPAYKTLYLKNYMISYGVTVVDSLRILALCCNLPGLGYTLMLSDLRALKLIKKAPVGKSRVLNLLYIAETDAFLLYTEDRVELRKRKSLKVDLEFRLGNNTGSNIASTYRYRDSKLYIYACGTYQGLRVIEPTRNYISVVKKTGEYVFDSIHYVKEDDMLLAASKELGAIRMLNPTTGDTLLEIALFSNNKLIHIHDYDPVTQLLLVSQGDQLSAWRKDPEVKRKASNVSECEDEEEEDEEECGWTLEASVEKTHCHIANEYCRKAEVALLDAHSEYFAYVNEEKLNVYNLVENDTVKFLSFSCTKMGWSSRWGLLFLWDTEGEGVVKMVPKNYLKKRASVLQS